MYFFYLILWWWPRPKKEALDNNAILLQTLYATINANMISLNERKRLGNDDDAFTYGEIDVLSLRHLLSNLKPKKGDVFYDLGCGCGKAVFTAALYFDLSKSCGIELLPALYEVAETRLEKAQPYLSQNKLACIHFINDNFLNCDFSDGDIILIIATCYSYPTWERLVEKMTSLKPGSRIIVATKKIQHEQFELISTSRVSMSWGMNSIHVYRLK